MTNDDSKEGDGSCEDEGLFLEVMASGLDNSLFNAELSWNKIKWPFQKDFEKKFSLALGVFQKFIIDGHGDFRGLKKKGLESLFLHVQLCNDLEMKSLNQVHRNKNKTTDVLSFPLYENIRAGDELIFEQLEFGDIIISVPVMQNQAVEFKVSVEGEFFHLLTHGFLHLCGYDHELSKDEEDIMEEHEQRLIKEIYELIY